MKKKRVMKIGGTFSIREDEWSEQRPAAGAKPDEMHEAQE